MAEIKIKTTDGNNAVTLAGPASGADVTLKLPTAAGSAGEFLKTDGSNGQLSFGTTSDTKSFRNVIINGAMQVSQRGTSETGISSQGKFRKAPDRFKFSVDDGTWTASQDSSGPPGFANSYKVDCTTADTSIAAGNEVKLDYKVEGQDLQHFCKGTSSAKKFCLQFWVKSNKTGNYAVQMRDQDNTRHVCHLYTISSADTWEQKKIVFPADTTGAFGDDINNSLTINWYLSVGTNKTSGTMDTSWAAVTDANIAAGQNVNLADSTSNYLNITGVQLEAADACTDFEHRSYADELLRCQRYYQVDRSGSHNTMYESWTGPNGKIYQHNFITTMRAAPSVDYTNGTNSISNSGWGGATPTGHASVDHVLFHHGSTLFHLAGTSNGNIGITYDSEL